MEREVTGFQAVAEVREDAEFEEASVKHPLFLAFPVDDANDALPLLSCEVHADGGRV